MSLREVLIEDEEIALLSYTHDDDWNMFLCWQDLDTQIGYNTVFSESFEEFRQEDISRFPFYGSLLVKKNNQIVGAIRLSPPEFENDLAIWIFKDFRNKSFGFRAFVLGLHYCFQRLTLEKVIAGTYEGNIASKRILEKAGMKRYPEGDLIETDPFHDKPITQLSFMITKAQFTKR
jgi:RimJ/RimL family protein N-acetyltransferase